MGNAQPLRSVSTIERYQQPRSDVTLTLPARPENVAVVRHVLGAFAEALRLPDELIEDLRLAVTEACTNVVRHAYPDGAPGAVEISVEPEPDQVRIVVADYGRGIGTSSDTLRPRPRSPVDRRDRVDRRPAVLPGRGQPDDDDLRAA